MKGKDSTYRPPAGTVCLVSGPHADDFVETTIQWTTDILVLYGQPGLWPILTTWELIICKPLEETLPPIKFGYFIRGTALESGLSMYFGNSTDASNCELVIVLSAPVSPGVSATFANHCIKLNEAFHSYFKQHCLDVFQATVKANAKARFDGWFGQHGPDRILPAIDQGDTKLDLSYTVTFDGLHLELILNISRLLAERDIPWY